MNEYGAKMSWRRREVSFNIELRAFESEIRR